MEKVGPLYHRNGAKLCPQPVSRLIIGIAMLIGVAEVVLGILSAIHG